MSHTLPDLELSISRQPLKNVITVKFIRPPVRKYEVENLYEKKKILTKAKGGNVRGKIKKR